MSRILLVDDEPSILKDVGKRLELAGFTVLTAVNGAEGLAAAQREQPDLVILDLMLPKLSGFEVCSQLRQDPRCRRIPVIIFTGKGDERQEQSCRALGANDYVLKSQGTTVLLARIRAVLETPQP